LPATVDSYEETPETLLGYIRRDRRWCQGNMQHLRLIGTPGLHTLSRFHFLQGAMAYLSSLWWVALLCLWALLGEQGALTYFQDGNPSIPVLPQLPPLTQSALALVVMGLLLAPKALGLLAVLRTNPPRHGKRLGFALTALAEIAVSMLLAPMLMVHQARAVLAPVFGRGVGWQPHLATRPGLGTLLRFHAVETGLGLVLTGLAAGGLLTPWVLPVSLCLCLTVPVSALVAQDMPSAPRLRRRQIA
jgi:membrane glycosyltransferase